MPLEEDDIDDIDPSEFDSPEETTAKLVLFTPPDKALAKQVAAVAKAISDREDPQFPEFPAPIDYSKPLAAIASALTAIPTALRQMGEVCTELKALTKAVGEMKSADTSQIVKAIEGLTKAQTDVAAALNAPREVMLDDNDNVVGLRRGRVN